MLKYTVGIDVSGEQLRCCFSCLTAELDTIVKSSRKFSNNGAGFRELSLWMEKHRKDKDLPLMVVMEATGVYHEALAYDLYQKGYSVCVVVPSKAKKYLQSLGLKSKTDPIDSRGLAQMGAEQKLPAWKPISDHIYQIRSSLRHREHLNKTLTSLRNQLHAQKHMQHPNTTVMAQLQVLIKTILQQIKQLDEFVRTQAREDKNLYEKVCRIEKSLTGVGFLTVLTLVAETNGFELFRNLRQLTSYSGYDVIENQSGKRAGKTKISKHGNAHIRRALHMPALNVVRFKLGNFHPFFTRVLKRSGIKMKAYVAVQRKLLCLIYTLWKTDAAFDPKYESKRIEAGLKKEVAQV